MTHPQPLTPRTKQPLTPQIKQPLTPQIKQHTTAPPPHLLCEPGELQQLSLRLVHCVVQLLLGGELVLVEVELCKPPEAPVRLLDVGVGQHLHQHVAPGAGHWPENGAQ